ncbi:MAG: hypothetical protein KC501_11445 [Myxococcales bacterium]|nr:hypothetical protein [Myxococcales bacterium]
MTTALGLLLASMLVGPAQSDAARRAEAAFEAKDYPAAAQAAAEAYAEQGDPVFLYAQAQAERLGGDCRSASTHYREFLRAVPTGPAAEAARSNIEQCEATLAEVPPEPSSSTPKPDAGDPTTTRSDPGAEPLPSATADLEGLADEPGPRGEARPPIRDPWGWALVGVGTAALGTGAGLIAWSRVDARAAAEATDVLSYGERIDRAYVVSRVGIPVLVVGGALVVAGVTRFALLARRRRRAEPERIGLGPAGVALRF